MADSYDSACAKINPRLEREILDRQRRIQELLRRAASVPDENNNTTNGNSFATSNNNVYEDKSVDVCGITVETKERKA